MCRHESFPAVPRLSRAGQPPLGVRSVGADARSCAGRAKQSGAEYWCCAETRRGAAPPMKTTLGDRSWGQTPGSSRQLGAIQGPVQTEPRMPTDPGKQGGKHGSSDPPARRQPPWSRARLPPLASGCGGPPLCEGGGRSPRSAKDQVLRTRTPTGLDRATLTDRWHESSNASARRRRGNRSSQRRRDKASARRRRANRRLPDELPIGITLALHPDLFEHAHRRVVA
jgi:hypothetical protein